MEYTLTDLDKYAHVLHLFISDAVVAAIPESWGGAAIWIQDLLLDDHKN